MSKALVGVRTINDYLAQLSDNERREVAEAEIAIDLARILYNARQHRSLSQQQAAELAHMHQQAVSRIERPGANIQWATLQRYLTALGYSLEVAVRDDETGEVVGSLHIPADQNATLP